MAERSDAPHSRPRIVLFSYGFRPFFLLVGLWAIVPIVTLLVSLSVQSWPVDA